MGVGGSLYAGEGDGRERLTMQTGERELDYYTGEDLSGRASLPYWRERETRKRGGETSTVSLPVCLSVCLSVSPRG